MAGGVFWGLIGWYYLPTFVANVLQKLWYGIQFRFRSRQQKDPAAETPAAPAFGSPEYIRHHRRILLLVTIGYLCWNTMNMARTTTSDNFYTRLDLKFDHFTQKQLRTNFRKLSLKYHPDKVGETGAGTFSCFFFESLSLGWECGSTTLPPMTSFRCPSSRLLALSHSLSIP